MARRRTPYIFFTGLLIILGVFFTTDTLEIMQHPGLLVLAILITLSFFLDLLELFASTLISFFLINWQHAFGLEFFLFFFIPLISYALKEHIFGELWINNLAFLLFGIGMFEVSLLWSAGVLGSPIPANIFENIALSVALGAALYQLFDFLHIR